MYCTMDHTLQSSCFTPCGVHRNFFNFYVCCLLKSVKALELSFVPADKQLALHAHPATKFCLTIVSDFSWVLLLPQEKLKTMETLRYPDIGVQVRVVYPYT